MSRQAASAIGIAILVVLFVAINILADSALSHARIDMTDHNLYTLSDASKNVVQSIDDPIRLKFYYSESLASKQPQLNQYGKRVWELLQEYDRYGQDMLVLEKIDPEPFSEAEDRAAEAGLQSVSLSNDESFYFGLVGTNSTEGQETIPFFDPRKERFLEYDISQMIWSLTNPEKPTVGVLSSLQVMGGQPRMPRQQPQQPWRIVNEMRDVLDVQKIETSVSEIPDDIDVLLVIHPKNLSDSALYAIDQYLLQGRPAAIFVDPLCQADVPPGAQQNPMRAMQADRSSNLDRLFKAWGIEMVSGKVATDSDYAMRVPVRQGNQRVPFVAFISVDDKVIDDDDAITGLLSNMNFAYPGALRQVNESAGGAADSGDGKNDSASAPKPDWTPLITTSSRSMLVNTQKVKMPRPQQLLSEFESSGEPLTLAARLHGNIPSAFPDGPPASDSQENNNGDGDTAGDSHLTQSSNPANLIVASDVDMLTDQLWVREISLGQRVLGYRKVSDNGDFLLNALENLAGSSELSTLRARGTYSRPFTLVEEIRRDAEQEYLAEEQRLEEKRRELERKISELQQARPDSGEVVLSEQQRQELENYKQQQLETRDKLRQVRYNLNADVERLGRTVKIINTAAMPVLVAIVAIGLGAYRARRRKIDRRSMSVRE